MNALWLNWIAFKIARRYAYPVQWTAKIEWYGLGQFSAHFVEEK